MEIQKLKRKRSKYYNNEKLEDFERLMNRDKSNDIIQSNFFQQNKSLYDSIMFNFLNQKVKDLFSDYLDKMDKESGRYFLEGNNKILEIRKMF